jgi:hypothetical protein
MNIELTDEKLQDIYTDKKFRNQVAYAHGCYSAFPNSKFKYKQTCSHPDRWIVTEEQIALALKELERSQAETAERYKNSLLFVGMGMTYETETDIGNYRIRTEFLNKDGHQFFVEFGTAVDHEYTRCDFSIDREGKGGDVYNYAGLERAAKTEHSICRYTPDNILNLVNKTFGCNFTEIFIDNYDLSCDGVMCESPKKPKASDTKTYTNIISNGSKWSGEKPDPLDVLIDVLKDNPLTPHFAPFYEAGSVEGEVQFFGNFETISHVFQIDTNDLPVIKRLVAAIDANLSKFPNPLKEREVFV